MPSRLPCSSLPCAPQIGGREMTVEFQVMVVAFIRDWYMLQAQTSTGAQREEFTRRAKMYDRFIQDVAKPVGSEE